MHRLHQRDSYVPKTVLFFIFKSIFATLFFHTALKGKANKTLIKECNKLKTPYLKNCERLTVEASDHDDSKCAKRVTVEIHVIHPMNSRQWYEIFILRYTHEKLKKKNKIQIASNH